MTEDKRQHFFNLLEEFETGMLVTRDKETPALHSRPMQVAKVDPNGTLWFITSWEGNSAAEIKHNENVLVTFQKDRDRYISLSGRAHLVLDHRKLDEIWQDEFKAWFPEGKEDPHLVLIEVQPVDAEYWDNEGVNKIRYAFQAVTAFATNTTPEVEKPEQFGHVDFNRR